MANKEDDLKEILKTYYRYLNREISWSQFNMHGLHNHSSHMTTSEIDNMFEELGIEGEDRVFGASESSGRSILPSVSVKPKDVIKTELKKETRPESVDDKKTCEQLQIPKTPLETKEIQEDSIETPKKPLETEENKEDWVLIDSEESDDYDV